MDELIARNLTEVVTIEELNQLLEEKKHPTTYCGYETSGPVHIGHLVAVFKQLDFMEAGLKVKVLFADVHTRLNRKGGEAWIAEMLDYWRECFTGAGLKAEFITGSSFQYTREYTHDVLEIGLNSTLNRALRSMQEVARDIENAHVSQVIYPLMQAADIKALDADIAHGGMEQRKIHMLAREMLPLIGGRKPVCVHTPLLCSLQGPQVKMSSSKPETMITVDDTPEAIKTKVNAAYCPPEKEGNPILEINKLLILPRMKTLEIKRPVKYGGDTTYDSYAKLEDDYANKKLHPADLKKATAEQLTVLLKPIREHLQQKGVECKKPY
jgi:tyrosyl-tRNA synthetase